MSVSEDFQAFCNRLKMSDDTVNAIRTRYHQIVKRINQDYYDSSSESDHGLYVGSYGRGTEIWTSDIDVIVQLPYATYKKYNDYEGNGQSALLQEVKAVLQETYSTSHIKGDGQVIGIDFSDDINFEIVPAFANNDEVSFTYPDTNDGGSWKTTNPRAEIEAMDSRNSTTNKNLKRLCMMARAWKQECSVPMSGILIDTLAYQFMGDYQYGDKSYLYYDFMSRDFFEFLKNLPEDQEYWLAPGSNKYVYKKGNFQYKAKLAYNKAVKAIKYETDGYHYSSNVAWREIFGAKFPS
ncbi:MAG: nucleotidyltransferase [Candidatus Saccharibacteria bacterium]|nr:nucleotidyltransferase [Candidatus Saccharibacteria bacterium]